MGSDSIAMKPFDELAHETNQIYQSAYALLLPEAEQICSKNCSQSEVEHFLDYALSFCGSHEVLVLFKNVCRKYFSRYPEMIVSQINLYRELFEKSESENEK